MSENKPKKQPWADGSNRGQPRNIAVKIPQPFTVRQEATGDEKERYSDEKIDRRRQLVLSGHLNKITAVGAAVSVFTLLALFISLSYSRTATKAAVSQAETSQREFESSQRPWVSLNVQADKLVVDPRGFGYGTTTYQLSNVGHSVAKNAMYRGFFVSLGEETGKECDATEEWRNSLKKAQGGLIIFPNQNISASWPDQVTIKDMRFGVGRLRLIACLNYESPVDSLPHQTKMEYWVDKTDGTPLSIPKEGGSFDIHIRLDINGTIAN